MTGVMSVVVVATFFVIMSLVLLQIVSGAGSPPGGRSFRGMDLVLKPICERFGAKKEHPGRRSTDRLRRPTLLFDYGRTFVRLRHLGSKRVMQSQKTEVAMKFDHESRVPIWIESRTLSQKKHESLQPMPVDDEAFSRNWAVFSDNAAVGKQLLTPAVRWKLMDLSGVTGMSSLQVVIGNQQLRVIGDRWIQSTQRLMDLTQGSLEIFDQLMLLEAEGLEFVNAESATIIGEVRCPICSDDVMQDMVLCRRCKTPHCSECWEYNGKCATFACMENRCVRVNAERVDA